MNKNHKFLFDAGVIFISYFYYGIMQEKVTRGKYTYESTDETESPILVTEKYTYSLTLVLVLCVLNYLLASLVLKIWPQEEDKTRTFYYISVSTTYLLGMVCSNMALQWIPYPTQVVGKSAKPIPVMILGVLVGNKSYSLKKYLFVLLIVMGVVLFMFKDKGDKQHHEEISLGFGEMLLLLSLTMDGLLGGVQERIRSESKPSGQQMMKASNAYASLILLVAILVTGEGATFLGFASRHPWVIPNIIILGITQGIGQLFLYSMVSEFGPLVVSVVTTTRKFFTVMASVIFFGNSLTSTQWIGAVLVFTGLFLDMFFAKVAPKKTPTTKS